MSSTTEARVAVITGGSSGIGLHAARALRGRGLNVYELSRRAENAEPGVTHLQADVTDEAQVNAAVAEILRREGRIDILINNAGVQDSGRDIEINLMRTIRITEKYAIATPRIRAVVMVGSASAHTGSEFPEYAASKGGLLTYTKNAALRLAPRAVCNSIDPGGVLTDLNRPVMEDPELWNQIMALTPLRRWATPEEIAEWIYFVGVRNRFMTGQNLLIDGGEAGDAHFVWKD